MLTQWPPLKGSFKEIVAFVCSRKSRPHKLIEILVIYGLRLPVTKSYIKNSKYGGDHWEPASLAKLDAILESYANGVDVFYINCNEYFADSNGYLYKDLTGDGCHPTAKHYKTWREWMNWAIYCLGI